MAVTVTHTKVSTIPDDADTSLIRPSDWNDTHTLTGLGTMATQDANAVAITGGTISGVSGLVTSVTGTSPVVSSGGTTPAISMPAATTSVNGYLTSTDWTTFNNKGSGTITSVSGTAPVVSSGGVTPAISMAAATTSVNGYLTSTDWTTFNNKGSGSVTSVAATVPSVLSISGSPITTSGTLAITYSGTALPVLNGGTGVTTSTGTTNVVLSGSPTIVTPVIAQINDANGNAELKFSAIASAVNQVTIENAATGNPVHISATGTDTNIGIHLAPKGASGYINVQGGVDSTKRFMFNPDGGTTSTRTMLSTTQTVDRTLSLPDATDTLVGKATTDTLTNKSISGSTNTFTNIPLGTAVTGNLAVTNLNSGTNASASTFWRGDGTWVAGNAGTITSVTGTAPVVSSGGTTPAISMAAATTSVNGYLTSTDWTTFNNKGSGTVTSVAAITLGTTGTDLSSTVATGTTTPVITLQVPTASATNRGALSAADWTTFNSKGSGTVTSVTGTSPIVSSGGATPAISIGNIPVTNLNSGTSATSSTFWRGDGTWATPSATPAGSTTQVQYNNAGAFGANSGFTFNSTTGLMIAPAVQASNGLVLNAITNTTSYTILTGNNAMSVGPFTVATSTSITVPSGSRWVVL